MVEFQYLNDIVQNVSPLCEGLQHITNNYIIPYHKKGYLSIGLLTMGYGMVAAIGIKALVEHIKKPKPMKQFEFKFTYKK